MCVHGVRVFIAVCVQCTLDGLNAEHKPRVWVTILGRISRHFHFHFKHGMNVMENGNVERTVYMAFLYKLNRNTCPLCSHHISRKGILTFKQMYLNLKHNKIILICKLINLICQNYINTWLTAHIYGSPSPPSHSETDFFLMETSNKSGGMYLWGNSWNIVLFPAVE